jgi:dTDP-4-dehydrorhamnose 3,5-epimerase
MSYSLYELAIMLFTQTQLKGAYLIEIERNEDDRGFFARSYCFREFEDHGLNPRVVQCNISYNVKRGTLRGMHYQAPPCEEAKLVRCTRGSIYDVIIDLRPDSATFCQWLGVHLLSPSSLLTASRSLPAAHCSLLTAHYTMLYAPEGFAHGFLTLEDHTEVSYQMSEFYAPESARGFRWNDPAFGIEWPLEPVVISERDRSYEDFEQGEGRMSNVE